MRGRAVAAGVAAGVLAVSIGACGGSESSSDSNEAAGAYRVTVVKAEFPPRQRLGETTLLRLDVRNTGRRALPSLTVTITGGGREGRNSSLPFGYRDPAPGIAQPDRPVWALARGYPKLDGSGKSGGAETSNPKTFSFGPLKPGAAIEPVWKLSAVRAGRHRLFYEIGAGLTDETKAETATGTEAGGSFAVRISDVPPETVVTDSGEVVPAPKPPTRANR